MQRDCEAEPSVHRVLPDEWNGSTEVKPANRDAERRELVIAER